MSATAKPKSRGANPDASKEAAPAEKLVAVDRIAFAGLFRQFAARAQRAADESAAVARLLAHAADKLENPTPAATPPPPARKGAADKSGTGPHGELR